MITIDISRSSSPVPDLDRIVLDGQQAALRSLTGSVLKQARGNLGNGPMARSLRLNELGPNAYEIRSRHPGARAQESGAFIRPRHGKVLRLEGHGHVSYTPKPIRIKGKHYMSRALRDVDRLAERAYAPLIAALGNWNMDLDVELTFHVIQTQQDRRDQGGGLFGLLLLAMTAELGGVARIAERAFGLAAREASIIGAGAASVGSAVIPAFATLRALDELALAA